MDLSEISRRVAALLADPATLGRLLDKLGLAPEHRPSQGTFSITLRDGRPALVRYAGTETGSDSVFWRALAGKTDHPSITRLASLSLDIGVTAAGAWLARWLGYDSVDELPTPTRSGRTLLVTDSLKRALAAILDGLSECTLSASEVPVVDLGRFAAVLVEPRLLEEYAGLLGEGSRSLLTPLAEDIEPAPARIKRINDREDLILASSGHVLRRDRRTRVWSLVAPSVTKDGGLYVVAGRTERFNLAKLVLTTFRGPEPGMVPEFADWDPANCDLDNLSWSPPSRKPQAKGSAHGRSRLDEVKVAEIKRQLARGVSQKELAGRFGVSESTISRISKGKIWGHVSPTKPCPPASVRAPLWRIGPPPPAVDHFGEEEGLAAPPDDDFDEDGEPTAEGLDAAREALRRITGKTADEDDDALFAGLGDEPPPRARRAV